MLVVDTFADRWRSSTAAAACAGQQHVPSASPWLSPLLWLWPSTWLSLLPSHARSQDDSLASRSVDVAELRWSGNVVKHGRAKQTLHEIKYKSCRKPSKLINNIMALRVAIRLQFLAIRNHFCNSCVFANAQTVGETGNSVHGPLPIFKRYFVTPLKF